MTGIQISTIVIGILELINLVLLFFMIFLEKKKPQSIIAWMTILTFLPAVGFIFYILLGSGLSIRTRRMMKKKSISKKDLLENLDWKDTIGDVKLSPEIEDDKEFAKFCFDHGGYPCLYNDVRIFNFGLEKIASLKQDLLNAKESINMEYYIFANDKVGKEIMDILIQKAKEGVKVKFVYDSVGSKKAPRRFFNKLKKAGGEVAEFFPPFMHIRLINLKMNYRNHRKIVVIDGKIAYTGGMNIRDDHMGLHKKLFPWRDTHLRIEGSGAFPLQNIFLNDWRYASKDKNKTVDYIKEGYFDTPTRRGNVAVQILSSGPDSDSPSIKEAFIKLITNAKERIYIQTPYFVPDDSFYSAIRIAVASGVDVRIMIPKKPDKKVVYLPTLSYVKEMAALGVKIYLYNGFIHSKVILVDDNKLSVGTCNIDNRSFNLNFEDTVFIYSKELNREYVIQFANDMTNSTYADSNYFKKYPLLNKLGQAFFRLLSPLL